MSNCIYIDIETIPTQCEATKKRIIENAKVPGNIKKPETIEKWKEENAADLIGKTAFNGGLGHVCQISAIDNNCNAFTFSVKEIKDEKTAIAEFFEWLIPLKSDIFVGHNIAKFDLKFLYHRAVCLWVKAPDCFPRNPNPWDSRIFDTMYEWAGRNEYISLDELCFYFGIEGKGDIDGSKVHDLWQAGKHDEIEKYCMQDVAKVKAIHDRMKGN